MGVLLPSRKTLRQRRSTQLVRATGFLHREYEPEYFCAAPRLEPGLGCIDPQVQMWSRVPSSPMCRRVGANVPLRAPHHRGVGAIDPPRVRVPSVAPRPDHLYPLSSHTTPPDAVQTRRLGQLRQHPAGMALV